MNRHHSGCLLLGEKSLWDRTISDHYSLTSSWCQASIWLTPRPQGDLDKILEKKIHANSILATDGCDISTEIALRWAHWTLVIISQHWLRWWLGAVRQQAITWTIVDLDPCQHMVSLSHNELNCKFLWDFRRNYNKLPQENLLNIIFSEKAPEKGWRHERRINFY